MEKEQLIREILNCAYEVRRHLYAGYLESVYKKALFHELQLHNIPVALEVPVVVCYKDLPVGDFRADMIVDGQVIIELKAQKELTVAHELQLVNYLTATGIDDGLLLNFGAEKLQHKRKYRLYTKTIHNDRFFNTE